MKNRESLYPGRVKLTPVDAANGIYDLVRADEPQDPGTPLNKKLLDFAVAACGVTAGTATALTLDDEFGGFELVDGAKVNFRLHVASGVNPTLNVNGTGAKAIVNAHGLSLPANIPANTWINATYNVPNDEFEVDADMRAVWRTILGNSGATSMRIDLPDGYSLFRLRGTIFTTQSSIGALYVGCNIPLSYSTSGTAAGNFSSMNYGDRINTSSLISPPAADINLMIYVSDTLSVLSGTIASQGIIGVKASGNGKVNYIEITNVNKINEGSSIILEGIA